MKKIGVWLMSMMLLAGAMGAPNMTYAQLGLGGAKDAAFKAYGKETTTDIPTIVGKLIKSALGLLGIIAIVLIVYAGFLWMTARGKSEQVESSKNLMIQAVIGMIIILAAYAITEFVLGRIINATS